MADHGEAVASSDDITLVRIGGGCSARVADGMLVGDHTLSGKFGCEGRARFDLKCASFI